MLRARLTPAQVAARLAELRAAVARPAAPQSEDQGGGDPTMTIGQLAEFLKTRALTVAQFNGLPYPRRRWLLERAQAWRASVDNTLVL